MVSQVTALVPKRATVVVIPFNISCGHCWMCDRQRYAQCETTQTRDLSLLYDTSAPLSSRYTKLYGQVPGAQAAVPTRPSGAVRPHQRART